MPFSARSAAVKAVEGAAGVAAAVSAAAAAPAGLDQRDAVEGGRELGIASPHHDASRLDIARK
jgi:hypothetical protein